MHQTTVDRVFREPPFQAALRQGRQAEAQLLKLTQGLHRGREPESENVPTLAPNGKLETGTSRGRRKHGGAVEQAAFSELHACQGHRQGRLVRETEKVELRLELAGASLDGAAVHRAVKKNTVDWPQQPMWHGIEAL